MISKNFEFYKAQKVPAAMEQAFNAFLASNSFRFATQCESASTKKVAVSIFAEPLEEGKAGNVKAKVFRSVSFDEAEKSVNDFLKEKVKMKFSTQSFVENNITTVIFYE